MMSRYPLSIPQLLEIMQAPGAILALTLPTLGAQLSVAAELPFIGIAGNLDALELAEATGLQQFFFLPKRQTLTEARLMAAVRILLPQINRRVPLFEGGGGEDAGIDFPTAVLVLEEPPSLEWAAVVQKCSLAVRRAWRLHHEASSGIGAAT
jgi:hypothetical protein